MIVKSVTKASTKPVLFAHIAALDALLIARGREAQALRDELSMLRFERARPALPAVHAKPATPAYYQYVNACRRASYAAGQRTTTYKTFGDWSTSITG